jgi:hypothetical protein
MSIAYELVVIDSCRLCLVNVVYVDSCRINENFRTINDITRYERMRTRENTNSSSFIAQVRSSNNLGQSTSHISFASSSTT